MAAPAILPAMAFAGAQALGNSALQTLGMNKQAEISKSLMNYEWQNFKSPQAQVNALRSAGLNPAVVFGQGGSGQLSTPTPTLPSSPLQMIGLPEIGNYIKSMAEAKKVGLESVAQDLENQYLEQTLKDRVNQIGLQNNWTNEQTAKVIQEVGLLSGQFNEIQARIEKMNSEKQLTDKQVSWFDRHARAEIEDIKQSAEYKKAMANLTDEQRNLLTQTLDDLVNIQSLNRQHLEKVVSLLNNYGDAKEIVGLFSDVLKSIGSLFKLF